MFTIIEDHDEDIQDEAYTKYDLLQLAISDRVVFSTEDINTLEEIAANQSNPGSWLIDADRNSKEQAELSQLRITKAGDSLTLEVHKKVNDEFESAGQATFAEFVAAVNSL